MAEPDSGIIQDILNKIAQWLVDVVSFAGEKLVNIMKPIIDTLNSWMDTIFAKLAQVAGAITDAISNIYTGIESAIKTLLSNAFDFMKGLYDSIADNITGAFDFMTDQVVSISETVLDGIVNTFDNVKQHAIDIFDFVKDKILAIIEPIIDYVTQLFDDVKFAIGEIIDSAQRVVTVVIDSVETFINEVVDVVGGSLRSLLETIAEIPDDLKGFATLVTDTIEDFIGSPLNALPQGIQDLITRLMADSTAEDRINATNVMHNIIYSENSPPKTRDEAREFYDVAMPKGPISNWLANFALMILTVFSSSAALATGQTELLIQESFYNAPGKMLPPGDLVNSYHRQLHNKDIVVDRLRFYGYDAERANDLINLSETLPSEGDLLSWFLRGFIDESELDTKLKHKAWSPQSIGLLKKAAFFVPPVQDLISMAVREAFSPDIAEQFGQYEDFPRNVLPHAKAQGVDEDWMRRYWAAHWALPSIQMGFEMLHRGVIEQPTMDLLLRAGDVMPFWRDKITAISFNPYTRVDIRRMHAVGVLAEEEVFTAYKEIGYNEDKANKLTAFTLALNEDEPEDDPLEINQLTRSSIINFYKDGIIDRDTAFEFLIGLGNTEPAAELYLKAADLDEELETRKELTALILARFKNGVLEFEQAEDALSELGLETRELQKATLKLVQERERDIKMPSRADLDKFLLAGIIDDSRYKQMVQLHGYSEEWAGNYLKLLRSKESAG